MIHHKSRAEALIKAAEAHAAWLEKENQKFDDWRVTCPKCGKNRTGTLENLKKGCACGS